MESGERNGVDSGSTSRSRPLCHRILPSKMMLSLAVAIVVVIGLDSMVYARKRAVRVVNMMSVLKYDESIDENRQNSRQSDGKRGKNGSFVEKIEENTRFRFCVDRKRLNMSRELDIVDRCCQDPEGNFRPSEKNVVFIAQPKSGTTTIFELFRPTIAKTHSTAMMMIDKIKTSDITLGITRNPFSRYLSWFKFCICHCSTNHCPAPLSISRRAMAASFETIEDQVSAFRKWFMFVVRYVDNFWLSTSSLHWLQHNETGQIMADYIVTLETMKEDIPIVECLLGRKKNIKKDNQHNPSCGYEITDKRFTKDQVNRVATLKVEEAYTEEMRDLLMKKELFSESAKIFRYI